MADVIPVMPEQTTSGFDNRVQSPALPDMFGNMEKMANIRNLMNQNAIFQQTFQAKQRAGQIMATAPSVDEGLKRLQADPLTASFAPELMNSYRQLDLTNTQVQSAQQGMNTTGFHEVMKALPSAYTDMGSFQKAMAARLGTLSPMTQDYLNKTGVVSSLQSALFDGLPDDPTQKASEYRRRWNALMLGADFTPDSINAITGKNAQVDTGTGIQPTVERPTALGGGQVPVGSPINKTGVAPTIENVNGVPLIIGGPGGGAQNDNNALGVTQPGAGAGSSSSGASPGTAAPAGVAGDGTPVVPQGFKITGAPVQAAPSATNPTGMPVLSEDEKELSTEMAKRYGDGGLKTFEGAQTTMGMLKQMDSDLDNMVKSGGLGVPGTGAKARLMLENAANTVASITGKKPPFDPSQVASTENFIKAMTTMRLSVLNTMLGTQREAAQTISSMGEAVPNINNSYLGAKMLVETFRQMSQRVMDERAFDNWYMQQTRGNLTGAEEAFNKLHPAQEYARQAMDKFGMDPSGKFKDPQTVLSYIARGYLTQQQGQKILESQFPGGPAKHGVGAVPKAQQLAPQDNSGDANAFGAAGP